MLTIVSLHGQRTSLYHATDPAKAAIRNIVTKRLHLLHLETLRLPLGASETDKHVPILVSEDLATKDRVIVYFGERAYEPGLLAWRVIGEAGIKYGSMVEFIENLTAAPNRNDQHQKAAPGIIIANPCQLLWYRGGGRAVSDIEWQELPRPSGVHEAMRVDRVKNIIEGNEDYIQHVEYLFKHVLPSRLKSGAKLDIIGCECTGAAAVEYLSKNCEFAMSYKLLDTTNRRLGREWSGRVNGISFLNPAHDIRDMIEQGASSDFVDFISKRCRAYSISESKLETPVSGREVYGCNCYSSGEDSYSENVMVKCWGSVLDWFDVLNNNPDYEEIEFIYVEPEKDQIELGWPVGDSEDAPTNRDQST